MLGFGLTPAAWAQEHAQQPPPPHGQEASTHGGQEEHAGHEEHFHRNEVALILAGTWESEWVQSVVFGVTLGFAF
jgi:hypothetical protein